jgi:Ca2+-binding EF-hand superfamily protein
MKLGSYNEDITDLFKRFDTNCDGELSWEEIWGSLKPI